MTDKAARENIGLLITRLNNMSTLVTTLQDSIASLKNKADAQAMNLAVVQNKLFPKCGSCGQPLPADYGLVSAQTKKEYRDPSRELR